MKLARPTFNTTQIRKSRHGKVLGAKPSLILQQASQVDDSGTLYPHMDTYSTSEHDIRGAKNRLDDYDTAGRGMCSISHEGNAVGSEVEDFVVGFIMIQRAKIGKATHAMRHPEEVPSLATTPIHVTGIKDLKLFSRKILQLQSDKPWILEETYVSGPNEFLYALGREGVDGIRNPYDLCIVASDKARTQSRYYTISAFNVSEIERGHMSTTNVLRWLWERDIFNRLRAIPFFRQFKIWRIFTHWKKWITKQKFSSSRKKVLAELLPTNAVLQQGLMKVQCLCSAVCDVSEEHYMYSKSKNRDPSEEIMLISFSKDKTLIFNDYMALQTHTCSKAKVALACLREDIIKVIHNTLQLVAGDAGIPGVQCASPLDDAEFQVPFSKILEWRSTTEILKKFEKLCSNIILRMLQALVMKAVSTLKYSIQRSIMESNSFRQQEVESFQKMLEEVAKQPYSQSALDRVMFHCKKVAEDQVANEMNDLQLMERQANSFTALVSDVDMDSSSYSLILNESSSLMSSSMSIIDLDPFLADILRPSSEPIVPMWEVQLLLIQSKHRGSLPHEPKDEASSFEIIFSPSSVVFQEAFEQLLHLYEEVITSFSPISEDSRISSFTTASRFDLLRRIEEEASERKNRISKPVLWPNMYTLLHDYGPYEDTVNFIRKVHRATMNEIHRLSKYYQCYSDMVRLCSSVEAAASIDTEGWTIRLFYRAFALYHDQMYAMSHMVTSFLVGMVVVRANFFKDFCLSFPKRLLSDLEHRLPKLITIKANQLVKDMMEAQDTLMVIPSSVDTFASFLEDVDAVGEIFPQMEKTLRTITQLHNVAQEFDVTVTGEVTALYKSLFPLFRCLELAMLQAQATKCENVKIFFADIKSEIADLLYKTREIKDQLEALVQREDSLNGSSSKSLHQLTELRTELDLMAKKSKTLMEHYYKFGEIVTFRNLYDVTQPSWLPEEVHGEVVSLQDSLTIRMELFGVRKDWEEKVTTWTSIPIFTLPFAEVQREVSRFILSIEYMEKNIPFASKLLSGLSTEVKVFRSQLTTLSCLLNPALKFRHWDCIQQEVDGKYKLHKNMGATITMLTEMKVFEHEAAITVISNQASHEQTLENMLKKVANEWNSRELVMVPYKGMTERLTYILRGVEDLLSSLEDSLTTLNIIKTSKYVKPIKHMLLDWESRLVLMLETVEHWVMCQKNWLYLENIFTTVDMHRQLGFEACLFMQADKAWREAIRLTYSKPTALKAITTPGLLQAFKACHVILEQVFKSLENYLESIRSAFPRFNFISNYELLDIISHAKDFAVVQPYLSKLFGNIKYLEFCEEQTKSSYPILAMVSAEDERVEITKPCYARGSPEQWLSKFEQVMMSVVRQCVEVGLNSYDHSIADRQQWSLEHPGQVVLTVNQIIWTKEVEDCLATSECHVSLKSLHKDYMSVIDSISHQLSDPKLLAHQRLVLASLLTLRVHDRDVIQALGCNGITSSRDFEWARHLRYYWIEATGCCSLCQVSASFLYGNEYLGCLPRLVVTPLSERCYLTLTTAMHLHLGASPIGPAGTGKSETVKDLAKALGQCCLVINCSEGLDYKIMGRYLSGLCQAGIWCCFDEFNRIDIEVLSVISQQLQSIKNAKDQHRTRFLFEGKDMKLTSRCAVFITMNPGYTGRVELPDNLKSHFRPVAMMVPDTNLIAQVLLLTYCFTTATTLALKLTLFYETINAQISSQHHYDFGLRSLKAVISLAGDYLKRGVGSCEDGNTSEREKKALLLGLKNTTIPRLLAKDVPTAYVLLWDLFHADSSAQYNEDYTTLNGYIEAVVDKEGLELSPRQVQKCHELYNTLMVRHGVILLGPTGGGKTTVIKLLKSALNSCYFDYYRQKSFHDVAAADLLAGSFSQAVVGKPEHCQLEVVNPKAISVGELYGHTDSLSLEWKNGILARILLTFSQQTESELGTKLVEKSELDEKLSLQSPPSSMAGMDHIVISAPTCSSDFRPSCNGLPYPACAPVGWRWTLLDGPVDSEWIENLNSVLDDSKVLCLSNGERIKLHSGSRILFETDELANASPATVSRCGVVFLDPIELGWKPLVLSWMKTLPKDFLEKAKNLLLKLFDLSVDAGLHFLKIHSSELLYPMPGVSVVRCLCKLFDGLLKSVSESLGGLSSIHETAGIVRDTDIHSAVLHTPASSYDPRAKSMFHIEPRPKSAQVKHKPAVQISMDMLISNIFVFAYTWSFGGCFEKTQLELNEYESSDNSIFDVVVNQKLVRGGITAREKFDALVYKIFTSKNVNIQLPTSPDLIYSYYFNLNSNSFEPWKELVDPSQPSAAFLNLVSGLKIGQRCSFSHSSSYSSEMQYDASNVGLIPTVDLVRLAFLVSVLFNQSSGLMPNILLSGISGVGKSQLLAHISKALTSKTWQSSAISSLLGQSLLRKYGERAKSPEETDDNACTSLFCHVSAQLEGTQVQILLEKGLIRQGRSMLIPSKGKPLLVCLDDLHAAASDSYGSQSAHEFLRQLISCGGWYDRKMLTWKEVVDVSFLATQCTNTTSASRISERLLSRFCLLHLPEASTQSLISIYSTHLRMSEVNRFSQNFLEYIPKIAACSVFVLHEVRANLTPSPLKPHYIFCLKDISKVFAGLLRLHRRGLAEEDSPVDLMVNELARVFHDRCFPEDRDKVLDIISEGLRINFRVVRPAPQLKKQLSDTFYTDIVDVVSGYCPISNHMKIVKLLEKWQTQSNIAEGKNSQLLFFPLACEHVIRMVRVLRLPRGHILLIGLGGVGKRSCIQLACHIADIKYHCLTSLHHQTFFSEFLMELKSVLKQCGIQNQPTLILAADGAAGQQHQDMFFDVLHELVVGGQVLELFDKDELESIFNLLAENEHHIPSAGHSDGQLPDIFSKRVSQNLHVALCFTPLSEQLACVCRMFPALVTQVTVNVYDDWAPMALHGVALKYFQDMEFGQGGYGAWLLKELSNQIASVCVNIHMTVLASLKKSVVPSQISFVVTPSTFIHFLQTFTKHLLHHHRDLTKKREHLELGVKYLSDADEEVGRMKSELQQLQPQVLDMTEEIEVLIKQLAKEQLAIDSLTEVVYRERMDIAMETDRVTSLAKEAQDDLKSVLPSLKAAEEGLNSLKKSDLVEIRSYGNPPLMVTNVMCAVCVLLKEPTSWPSVKHIMSDPVAFLKRLTDLHKDEIHDNVLYKLKKYLKDPNFVPEKVAHYSVACQSFCQWVLAINHYCKVCQVVKPKRELHKKISVDLDFVVGQLQAKEVQLKELESRMEVLSKECELKKLRKNELENKYDDISKKLTRAEELMESLQDEQVRWKETLFNLQSKERTLLENMLLLSSCLAYLGPFTPSLRLSLMAKWQQICQEADIDCDKKFTLESSIGDFEMIQNWYVQGLPKDTQSVQSALILTHTAKPPFIIDPQGQAIKWLKEMLDDSFPYMMVEDYRSPNVLQDLKHAVLNGFPMIITGVPEHPSSMLDSFLEKHSDHFGHENQKYVGNSSFRLFLVYSNSCAQLLSDTCTKTTVINFSATLQGYQDQLLSVTINTVRQKEPILEAQHKNLLLTISTDRKQIEDLEKNLLECLSSSEGDLLDNEDLIGTLKDVKLTACVVKQRLAKAVETSESITLSRLKYERVASRGSILFFSVLSLYNLDQMYTFSSRWFMELFRNCIQSIKPPSEDHSFDLYLDEIVEYLTISVFHRVTSGILAKHFLPFSFKLCSMLLLHGDPTLNSPTGITQQEWMALLKNTSLLEPDPSSFSTSTPLRHRKICIVKPDEISAEAWDGATFLSKMLQNFHGLLTHIVNNTDLWVQFFRSPTPWNFYFECEEVIRSDDPISSTSFSINKINRFQRLLLVSVFCLEHLAVAVKWFVDEEMGVLYTTKIPCSLTTAYQEMNNINPVLIIITPGIQPATQLTLLAKNNGVFLETISLGQGQGVKAILTVRLAAERGTWVFLQNCHLAASWMPKLEELYKELQENIVDEDFRLWLSSKSTPTLPPIILQSSIKICLESATSIKTSMQQLISMQGTALVTQEDFAKREVPEWQQLLYNLCLFHSAANARRSYGREGWRVPYVFGPNDIQVSIKLLHSFLQGDNGGSLTWSAVKHLVGDICYGGKITDAQDMLSLQALLVEYCYNQFSQIPSHTAKQGKSGFITPGFGYNELVGVIGRLPNEDEPKALGLSSLLYPAVAMADSKSLLATMCLLDTASKHRSHEERTRDLKVLEMAGELLEKLPSDLPAFPLSTTTTSSYEGNATSLANDMTPTNYSNISPFWVVLSNEVMELNNRLSMLKTLLNELIVGVKCGFVQEPLVYKALAENTVPHPWKFGRDAPSFLQYWMQWFTSHYKFIEKWASMNEGSSDYNDAPRMPAKIRLTALTHVNGFLKALKQSYSRKSHVPVEETTVRFDSTGSSTEEGAEVVVLCGLKLSLGEWDEEIGLVLTTQAHQYSFIPELICWASRRWCSEEDGMEERQGYYTCPLYSSIAKEELITSIQLKTIEPIQQLQLLGITLILC